jgi:hypothetical protein
VEALGLPAVLAALGAGVALVGAVAWMGRLGDAA